MDNSQTWVAIVVAVLGASELWRLIQWLIHRKDAKAEKGDALMAEIKKMGKRIDEIADSAADDRATNARIRILRFSDEVRHGVRHSKEAFDQINLDIDMYKSYCREHPNYQNNRGHMAISNIERVYAECLKTNNFLE